MLRRLVENSRTLTVITFNYDTLAEQCLEKAEIPFGYGTGHGIKYEDPNRRSGLPRARDRVSVLKLHGSANWGVCRGCNDASHTPDMATVLKSIYVPPRRKRCPHCGEAMLEPGIIPPVFGKATEAMQLGEVWKKARQRLRRAREIVVVGYSLPESDLEAMDLLGEVFQPDQRPRVRLICGQSGASSTYDTVFRYYQDIEMYFEDYLKEEVYRRD